MGLTTMPGILESITERLDVLEHDLAQLRIVPTDPNEIWAEGAIRVVEAVAFSGLSRSELYELMTSGKLPWSKPARHRLVPRRWLVQWLAKNAFPRAIDSLNTGRKKPAPKKGKK
ncbi:MAG: hypothetical protein C0467_33090 [Planctomycetaceae bacterium]|nr:hypothetical protein [Planctomycetaceae bacterium]